MGKVKEMHFPEVTIYSSNKIPNDPEATFKKFADIFAATKRETFAGAGTLQIREIGPRENLSSKFRVEGKSNIAGMKDNDVETTINVRYVVNPKVLDIGYEVNCTSEKGEKKQVIKGAEQIFRIMLASSIEKAYESAVGEDFTLGSKKVKKIKKSRSEKYLDTLMNPEEGKKQSWVVRKSIEVAKEQLAAMQAEKVTDGSMCYIHPEVAGEVRCDLCKKAICSECLQNPLSGQKLYLKNKKELNKVPFCVCPNCVKEAKKKYGPTSWSQIRGYMRSHRLT
ncbi:MAG: hypothetical protein ACFFAN_09510 [Promethearchaeota archaeon]